ncbi:hypothetical protein Ancab_008299 [Ancistrocladus abbreviatus]
MWFLAEVSFTAIFKKIKNFIIKSLHKVKRCPMYFSPFRAQVLRLEENLNCSPSLGLNCFLSEYCIVNCFNNGQNEFGGRHLIDLVSQFFDNSHSRMKENGEGCAPVW